MVIGDEFQVRYTCRSYNSGCRSQRKVEQKETQNDAVDTTLAREKIKE